MAGDTRESTISLPVPGAVLESFDAQETFSELFTISVDVLCDDADTDFFPHLGAPVAIKVVDDGDQVRYFHGLLFDAAYVDETASGFRHRLILRPWLYALSRNRDFSIFQEKNVVDVIKAVFESRGCSDVDFDKLQKSDYKPREYCVQYRESDFDFVSRLMEEEGIYYFFRHEQDRHVMVLCDQRGSHPTSTYGTITNVSPSQGHVESDDHFWRFTERLGSTAEGKVTLRNFDFQRPESPREGVYSGGEKAPPETSEVFNYPAPFLEPDDGAFLGQVILESARRSRRSYLAEGDTLALACGDLFTLQDHPVSRLNTDYLVVALSYSLQQQSTRSSPSGDVPYTILAEATPAETPWRAPIRTPKPVAHGPETAIVTGPDGEEIFTDEFGRIEVRFHWDRSGSDGDKTTCWIRVSHNSAGGGFGNIILPRLGQEVIVDFLDGDPDRPIVTGRVYNKANMQTYPLPDNKTRSVWRSQTIGDSGDYDEAENPPTGPPGFNEIRMEDKGGEEEVFFHAQRNYTGWVRLDADTKIGRDLADRVGRDRETHIKQNETLVVETGDETHQVSQGSRTSTVQQDDSLTVQAGDYSVEISAGKATIEAAVSIELKVGDTSIKLTPSSIEMSAMTIKIDAEMSLEAKGGLTADVEGGLSLTLKGGTVMIN